MACSMLRLSTAVLISAFTLAGCSGSMPSLSLPSDRADLRVVELEPARRWTLLAVTRTEQPLVPAAKAFPGLLRQTKSQAAGTAPPG